MQFLGALGSIVVLDIVLAGDNAVVIAMASHNLPSDIRKKAVFIGTGGAILIRLLMTFIAVWLLTVPFLQAIGGLILLPIALKLLKPHQEETKHVDASTHFWRAVETIIIADIAMGVDNVLAIAGASHGNFLLVILGLIISVPIIVGGSQIIALWMNDYPILVYLGSGILAWTAGSMFMHDKIVGSYLTEYLGTMATYLVPALCAIVICTWGHFLQKSK